MSLPLCPPRRAFWSRASYRSAGRQRGFLNMHLAAIASRRRASGGLIDAFLSGLWGAYGLVKLVGTYTGSAIRVRRSSDNAEQDIGLLNGVLDTAALATFVGSNDAFVTKWYDQSGLGHDLVQATQANQPQIVDAGAYTFELLFDGVNDSLVTTSMTNAVTGCTTHLGGRQRINDAASFRTIMAVHGGAGYATQRLASAATDYRSAGSNSGSGANSWGTACTNDGAALSFVVDTTAGTVATQVLLYQNGALQASVASSGSTVAGNLAAATVKLGWDGGSQWSRLGARSLLVYDGAQSSGTVASIAALVQPSYAIDLLTNLTAGLWGAYSLRRLISTYAGSCLRVRRSSDNAEQDIGFVAGVVDSAALSAFVGAGTGFVTKWYDQSGLGHDLVQATTTRQPKIWVSGALTPVTFDGTTSIMSTTANSGTPSAFTAIMNGLLSSASVCVVLEQTATVNANSGAAWYINDAVTDATNITTTTSSNANRSYSSFSSMLTFSALAARWDRSQVTAAAQSALFSGGSKLTRSANSDAGTLPTGNFIAAPWNLGARSGAVAPAPLLAIGLALYESALSDANVERVTRAMGG